MSKHTPGPWDIDVNQDWSAVYIGKDIPYTREEKYICQIDCDWSGFSGEVLANARLIAAAPEMYEIIKARYDYLCQTAYALPWDTTDGTQHPDQEEEALLGQLIAKIEGTDNTKP